MFQGNGCILWIEVPGKVHIFWEGHEILRNLYLSFDYSTYSQKLGEDFAFSEYMNFKGGTSD